MSRPVERWVRNKSDEAAIDAGCYFDTSAADRFRFFCSRFLRHSKGEWAGKPFELLDWQFDRIIGPLYGWKRPNGARRFNRVGIAVPKKNGKSTLLSAIGLYGLIADGEPGAEVYSAAGSRKQASIIFDESANMVEASPALMSKLRLRRATKEIYYPRGKSVYQAISSEAFTKEGLNIHYLLFDELHAQKTRELFDALKFGGRARRQPIYLWITTAGVNRESLCYEEWQKARAIQDSLTIDTEFLPCIYEADEGDDWKSEGTWRKVNPSFGVTINADSFASECRDAQRSGAGENTFKRYSLNLWTETETRWIPSEQWRACVTQYGERELRGKKCWAGLDLSSTSDLTAFVLLFRDPWRVLPYFWIPQLALKRRARENRVRLDNWAKRGLIRVCEGNAIDYGMIRKDINELRRVFNFPEVAIDPWNATHLATDLQSDGFSVAFVRTGFASISAATKEFERLVLNGELRHNDNPVLNWNVANTTVEQDASGNIKPSKAKSSEKIDGVVAAITALARAIADPPKKQSRYEREGIFSV